MNKFILTFLVICLSLTLFGCSHGDSDKDPSVLLELADNKIFKDGEVKELTCSFEDAKRFMRFKLDNIYFEIFCMGFKQADFYIPFQFTDVQGRGPDLYQQRIKPDKYLIEGSMVFKKRGDLYLVVKKYNYAKNFLGEAVCIRDFDYYKWEPKFTIFKKLSQAIALPISKIKSVVNDCISN